MATTRLSPPFWQHDAYTLNLLASSLRQQAAEMAKRFAGRSQPCAIDLGAGAAPYRPLFTAGGFQYVTCDLDGDPQVRIRPGEGIPRPSGEACLVLSFQVLEHVWDLDWYLSEARRLLADDGRLVLSTHGTWLFHPHPTDFRRWTRTGLQAELKQRGFETESIQGLVGPLAWTTQFRAIGFHHLLTRLPVVGSVVAAVVSAIFHARMKIEDWVTPQEWIDTNAAIYLVVARKTNAGPAAGA